MPLDVDLVDGSGRPFRLAQRLRRPGKPVVLALVYYDCPMLCGLILSGHGEGDARERARARQGLPGGHHLLRPGARSRRRGPSGGAATSSRWRAPTRAPTGRSSSGSEAGVARGRRRGRLPLQARPGHRRVGAPGGHLRAHAGRHACRRYLYGIEYPPKDLRLALVEAADGKVGTSFDRFLLTCYRYDPASPEVRAVRARDRARGRARRARSALGGAHRRAGLARAADEGEATRHERAPAQAPLPARAGVASTRASVDALHYFVIITTMLARGRRLPDRASSSSSGTAAAPTATRPRTSSRGSIHEVLFIGVPLALFLALVRDRLPAVREAVSSPPKDAMDVYVQGQEVDVEVRVPRRPERASTCCACPAGRPVRLLITSRDVIHSFFVPGAPHQAGRAARAATRRPGSTPTSPGATRSSAPSTAASATPRCSASSW